MCVIFTVILMSTVFVMSLTCHAVCTLFFVVWFTMSLGTNDYGT